MSVLFTFAAWAGAHIRVPRRHEMRLNSLVHGASMRRLACLAAVAGLLALSGCADDEDAATGTPFTQALAKNYGDLANQASALPAPPEEGGFLDALDVFGLFSGGNPNEDLAKAFTDKADSADSGEEPDPDAAPADSSSQALRARLIRDLAQSKEQLPAQAARAQADYDCWVMSSEVPSAAAMGQACRTSLDGSLAALEGRAAPPPPQQQAFVPPPAPVQTAPVAPVAPAPAPTPADFTVYFEFDSWTLTAEDLKVITDVINTARAGGQAHITIVGHTDTSGPAPYNQKLSVRRANVVVEALVDLGARRNAINASGVGENDLAVQTGDNVKEAKNRRAVITLQP
jgi:outer membrane protein OmpA-like peptidoglycan-associated protein